ncbi:MAG TPA: 4Fe-4S dicluster domain-containing protein [Syntrophorhabdaceae bacterium]|jgi:heterodisulfide reductase subunit C
MKDLSFLNEMENASGQKISGCYQCYRCTVGCPVVKEMDIYPHRVIRYIILGERERVLASKTVWTCLQCVTCSVRCPNDIDIAHVFDTIRKIAMKERTGAEEDTWKFDRLFLESVRKHGRLHEIEAVIKYKVDKKNFFEDTKMGVGMMVRGRLGILPHNIKDRNGFKEIFARIEAEKKERGQGI